MFNLYLEATLDKIKINNFLGSGTHTFLHLSKSPNLTIDNIKCPPSENGVYVDKPQRTGFWVAPNLQWAKFVANNKDINVDKYLYRIKLDLSNCLIPNKTPLNKISNKISIQTYQNDDFIYYDWAQVQKVLNIDAIWFKPPVPGSWSIVNESVYLFNKKPIKEIKFLGDYSKSLSNKIDK